MLRGKRRERFVWRLRHEEPGDPGVIGRKAHGQQRQRADRELRLTAFRCPCRAPVRKVLAVVGEQRESGHAET